MERAIKRVYYGLLAGIFLKISANAIEFKIEIWGAGSDVSLHDECANRLSANDSCDLSISAIAAGQLISSKIRLGILGISTITVLALCLTLI